MTAPRIMGIMGIVLALLGTAASIAPEWFPFLTRAKAPAPDVYEAIERRVRGGMVLGLGLAFLAIPSLRPWSVSVPTAVFYVVTGALAARIVGLLTDGTHPKQWLWVAVEAGIMLLAALWLWRTGEPPSA